MDLSRRGFLPWSARARGRIARLATLVALYTLFLCLWIVTVKHAWELFNGAWVGMVGTSLVLTPDFYLLGPMLLECTLFGTFPPLIREGQ